MNKLVIKRLDPVMLPLVQKFYKEYYPAGKARKNELIYAAYSGHTLVAVVRFREIDRWRLLTGMVVLPDYRGKGVGHQLMSYLEENVLRDDVYCFSFNHLDQFYGAHGFREQTTLTDIPTPLLSLYNRYMASGRKLCLMKFDKLTQN